MMHFLNAKPTLVAAVVTAFALITGYLLHHYHTKHAKKLGLTLKEYYLSKAGFKKLALAGLPFLPLGLVYLTSEGVPLFWSLVLTAVIVGWYALLYFVQLREIRKKGKQG